MAGADFGINELNRRDVQVMREGADINVLHDDFTPLSNLIKATLRVLATLCVAIAVPTFLSILLYDPKSFGHEANDNLWDTVLRIADHYGKFEFTWGLLAGLTIGILATYAALAIYKYRRRHGWTTVASAHELEALFSIRPVFGLPSIEDPLREIEDVKSSLSEAMISLETVLQDNFQSQRRIMITSSRPAEGKSTLAIALAHTLARSGRRVIVLDCDLRSPSVHKYVGLENRIGMSNLLAGQTELLNESIQQAGAFWIIPSGPVPPSAPSLLRSTTLESVLDKLEESFDHIIVDAAPVLGLADAVILARYCEIILYAIEANTTWVYHALAAIRRLGRVDNVVPVVSKVPSRSYGYTFGYGYAYGYGYGD
jgi:succinoglycan biosynthesis transport protein ExoP